MKIECTPQELIELIGGLYALDDDDDCDCDCDDCDDCEHEKTHKLEDVKNLLDVAQKILEADDDDETR